MVKRGVKRAIEGLNEEAGAYYVELLEILKRDGRFREGDERALARLCYLYSLADRFEKEVNDAWSKTLPKSNLSDYDKIIKQILSLESAFHLNPNSRKQKTQSEKPEKKGFDTGMKVSKSNVRVESLGPKTA